MGELRHGTKLGNTCPAVTDFSLSKISLFLRCFLNFPKESRVSSYSNGKKLFVVIVCCSEIIDAWSEQDEDDNQ